MAKQSKEFNYRPNVVGFYQPHSRSTDFTGEVVCPFTGTVSRPPSMTKQEFASQCDINNIIREFTVTGQVTHISAKAQAGAFLDLPDPMDLQESFAVVERAQSAFMELPAKVRERFGNDPTAFMEFMHDPANEKEAREMGLLKPLPAAPQSPPQSDPPPKAD